jgi:hypothetical protein
MITLENKYETTFLINRGGFIWVVMPFGLKNVPPTYQWVVNTTFKGYLGVFMKLFLDDISVFSDLNTHLTKLQLCFDKCKEFGISLNLEKLMFFVHLGIILGYVVFRENKLLDLKKFFAIIHIPTSKTPKDI